MQSNLKQRSSRSDWRSRLWVLWLLLVLISGTAVGDERPFRITVVDAESGRGIPLVELKTVGNVRYVTDSAGVVCFFEPGLMHERVFFHVSSHGYESPDGGFGTRGAAFDVRPGAAVQLKLKRLNIAERLYRVTGAGIYRDSVLLQDTQPLKHPLLNAGVMGSDSVVSAVFQNRIYWFWGDTNLPRHPLGIFDVPGATSQRPALGGLNPEVGINLDYFRNNAGKAKATCDMPGSGPTWIGGLTVVPDESGNEHLVAGFVKIKPPLEAYQRGLVGFDVASEQFQLLKTFDANAPLFPDGHPLTVQANQQDDVYFPNPFPLVRVPATYASWQDLSQYEAYTCLQPGSTVDRPLIDRDSAGVLKFSWKAGVPPVQGKLQESLIASGAIRKDEVLFRLLDVDTGKPITCHGGSVYWNEHRQRYVTIMLERFGTSVLGEVWYAEADTVLGPWQYARKIVTHDNYSFYNPKQHPEFDQQNGRIIFFEGTYTHTFSGNKDQTPRYDYNQIMYRLNLEDSRLALPVAVYQQAAGQPLTVRSQNSESADRSTLAFFAQDRQTDFNLAVYQQQSEDQVLLTRTSPDSAAKPVFYGLPVDIADAPLTTVLLYEDRHPETGERRYSTAAEQDAGFERGLAVCRVWSAELSVAQK